MESNKVATIEPIENSNSFTSKIYKYLTLGLFFILPSKITNAFVNLSILAAIYNIRNTNFSIDKIDIKRIQSLLKITISKEILLLPNYTIYWFWDENFLNTKTVINNQEYTIKQIITNNELFFSHLKLVIGMFLDHLPGILKLKLGIKNVRNRIRFKHSLMNILIYS